MISFASDYIAGAHPAILEKLQETNMEMLPGYGTDHYTDSAKEKIKKACDCPDADIYFLVGGTQTNSTIIATMLNDFEGAIAVETGHIEVHEAGAVEYTGHKVLTLPAHDGKMDPDELRNYIKRFYQDGSYDHMVFPGMVYISHPTVYGTLLKNLFFIFIIVMELCIQSQNFRKFTASVRNTTFLCLWMVPDWDMVL